MEFKKWNFSVLELSYVSLFLADMWLPSSKQGLEELSYIFVPLIICMACITV